jgi:hypothetical protein
MLHIKLNLTIGAILLSLGLYAQGVKIDKTGGVPNANAILDVEATDAGMLIPRMTTAQRTTLGSGMGAPEDGMMVYDTSTSSIWYWDGGAWVEVGREPISGSVTSSTGTINRGTGFTVGTVSAGVNDITFSTPLAAAPTVLLTTEPYSAPPGTPTYCATSFSNTADEWISNVTFNTINNNSGSTTYSDFTAQSTTVTAGNTYLLSVQLTVNGAWLEEVQAWFDWNQDGDFTDAGEAFYVGSLTGACAPCGALTTNVTIPTTALNGNTRMRVIERYNQVPGSCDNATWGEPEDYTVNITGGGTPTLGNVTNVTNTGFRLIITDLSGVTLDTDYHFNVIGN